MWSEGIANVIKCKITERATGDDMKVEITKILVALCLYWLAPVIVLADQLKEQSNFVVELCLKPDEGGELIRKNISGGLTAKKEFFIKLAGNIGLTLESEKWKGLLPVLPEHRLEDYDSYRDCTVKMMQYLTGKEKYEKNIKQIQDYMDSHLFEVKELLSSIKTTTIHTDENVSLILEIARENREFTKGVEEKLNTIILMSQPREYVPLGFGISTMAFKAQINKFGGKELVGKAGRISYTFYGPLDLLMEYGDIAWSENRGFATFPGLSDTVYIENNNHDFFLAGIKWNFYRGEYFRPYAGLAYGKIKADVDSNGGNENIGAIFTGLDWRFSKYFALFSELRCTKTRLYEKQYKFNPFGESQPDITPIKYVYYSVMVGATFYF